MNHLINTFLLATTCFLSLSAIAQGQDKYAVLVGVESYNPSVLSTLKFAEEDALALCRSLTNLGFKTKVMTGQSKVSTGKPNSPAKILTVLRTQMNNCSAGDTIVITLSGHGLQFSSDQPDENDVRETYFCPEDADPSDKSTLLPVSSVITLLRQCEASRKLLMIDACRNDFANTPGQKKSAKQLKLASVHETRRSIPRGMNVMFSCDQEQFSFEDDDLKHSVFSHFVINYLNGNAGNRYYDDNQLSLDNMIRYVRKRTNEYVSDNNLAAEGQTPVSIGSGTDWNLGVGIDPIVKVLNRHIDWLGGLENLRKIKTIFSKNRLVLDGTTYYQENRFHGDSYLARNFLNGSFHSESGNNFTVGWFRQSGVTSREENSKIKWFSNHHLAILNLLELVQNLQHIKQPNGLDTIRYNSGQGDYIDWNILPDGSIKTLVMFLDGEKTVGTYYNFVERQGIKFWSNATYERRINGNLVTTTDQVTDFKVNSPLKPLLVPPGIASSTILFDVDEMIEDFRMFTQELVQSSNGFLSDIKYKKISDSSIGIDYVISPTGYFTKSTAELKATMLESFSDVIEAGLILKVKYFSSTGMVQREFSVSAADR